jgi:diguanylate cyclase (GGDEF)-like protein
MQGLGAQLPLLTYPQLQNALKIEFARARRYSYPLSCLVVVVDGLDRIRDVHGSTPRDQILARVVLLLQTRTRASDSVGLYHDRIAVILPHTDETGARSLAERVRERVKAELFRAGAKELHLTVSLGLSSFAERTTIFFDSILKTAEGALQAAVAAGGDRLEIASPGQAPPGP